MGIGVRAWKDGFELFWNGSLVARHSSAHPCVWMDPAPRQEGYTWKSAGPAFALESAPDRAAIAFPGFARLRLEDEGQALKITFVPPEGGLSAAGTEAAPGLRLRLNFGFPGGAFGLAPSSVYDQSGRWVPFRTPSSAGSSRDPAPEKASVALYPRVFSRSGAWIAIDGGGKGSLRVDAVSLEVRSARPWERLYLGKADAAWKSMAALDARRGGGETCADGVSDADPVMALRKLLSYSFCAETVSALGSPGEPRLGETGSDRFRFIAETGPFGLEFDCAPDPPLGEGRGQSAEERLRLRARLIHAAIQPYREDFLRTRRALGLPYWAHPGIRFPEDTGLWARSDQIMAGNDIFLAPSLSAGQRSRELLLPRGRWVHLWTSREYPGGETVVDSPLGNPAVFWREASPFALHFEEIRKAATRL